MKTRLHTADVLTFTLTGVEPQRALTLAALHDIRLFHIRALPSGVQAQIAGVDWPRLQALLEGPPSPQALSTLMEFFDDLRAETLPRLGLSVAQPPMLPH